LVKIIKCYCNLKNIFLIISFILLIIFINISIKNSFSDNSSKSHLNGVETKQNSITNQSFTHSNLQNLKGNFFYLKNNKLFVPINFYSEEKSILNNAIYVKEKNSIILILNPIKPNNNTIIVQIPSILDSKIQSNKDNKFTVLIDDKPSKFLEITHKNESDKKLTLDNLAMNSFLNNTSNRELSIKFGKDAKVIEILGTDLSNNHIETQLNNESKEKFQKIFPILSGNKINYLIYNIKGGNLKDSNVKQNSAKNKTLNLFINPFDANGNLVVQIPRSILDSKTQSNKDNKFTVLIDDKPSKFLEITHKNESDKKLTLDNLAMNSFLNNTSNRELSIKFGKDAKVIEILGTDLSNNQNHNQPQGNWFITILSILFISLSILSIIIICLYKRGRFGLLGIFKIIRKKQK
jgi:phage antirepressor YoqD-like protein